MTEDHDRIAEAKAAIQRTKAAKAADESQKIKSEEWAKERAAKHAAKIRDVGRPAFERMMSVLAESEVNVKVVSSDSDPVYVGLEWPSIYNPEKSCVLKLTTEGGLRVDSECGPRSSHKTNANDMSGEEIQKLLWDRFKELLEWRR